jgi:hypothetical protein
MHSSSGSDQPTFFETCATMAGRIMREKVIANDTDSVGVVFFGTVARSVLFFTPQVRCKRAKQLPWHVRLRRSGRPICRDDQILRNDITLGSVPSSLTTPKKTQKSSSVSRRVAPSAFISHFGLAAAFSAHRWVVSESSQRRSSNARRRILIFTNNDNPTQGDATLTAQALQKAKVALPSAPQPPQDLVDLDISVELIARRPPIGTFSSATFYKVHLAQFVIS